MCLDPTPYPCLPCAGGQAWEGRLVALWAHGGLQPPGPNLLRWPQCTAPQPRRWAPSTGHMQPTRQGDHKHPNDHGNARTGRAGPRLLCDPACPEPPPRGMRTHAGGTAVSPAQALLRGVHLCVSNVPTLCISALLGVFLQVLLRCANMSPRGWGGGGMLFLFEICKKSPFQKDVGHGGVGDHIFSSRAPELGRFSICS